MGRTAAALGTLALGTPVLGISEAGRLRARGRKNIYRTRWASCRVRTVARRGMTGGKSKVATSVTRGGLPMIWLVLVAGARDMLATRVGAVVGSALVVGAVVVVEGNRAEDMEMVETMPMVQEVELAMLAWDPPGW